MTSDKPCGRQDPHIPHFWNGPGFVPVCAGTWQFCCPGKEDLALAELSEDQLKLAIRELARRQDAARKAREEKERLQREMRRAELARRFATGLADYFTAAGWTPPADWSEAAQIKLLEQADDLMYDYRDERDSL